MPERKDWGQSLDMSSDSLQATGRRVSYGHGRSVHALVIMGKGVTEGRDRGHGSSLGRVDV